MISIPKPTTLHYSVKKEDKVTVPIVCTVSYDALFFVQNFIKFECTKFRTKTYKAGYFYRKWKCGHDS